MSAVAADVRILLPLYAYPEWWDSSAYIWDDVAAQGTNAPITAIINPNNGPDGGPPNEDFVRGMADLRAGGVGMIGYVYTGYGNRSASAVKADIDWYSADYDVDGIFLDEVPSTTNKLAYYGDLYDYISAKGNLPLVIANPGTHIAEAYLSRPATDVAVIYEDDSGWSSYVPDAYVAGYPASRFAALCYGVAGTETMRTNVDLAVRRNAGYVYVTDDGLPDPWDSLPTYWPALVDYVRAYRGVQATGLSAGPQGVQIGFTVLSNRPWRVEWSTNLTGAAWVPLTATATSTGTVVQATDTNVPSPSARAYRLKMFP